jgi:RNA polymerase sigma-70 factor (ECF subfamily)
MNPEPQVATPATSTGLLTRARDLADRPAWERLVAIYEPLLHGWLRRQKVQHADAEDLIQGVLSAVAAELQGFQHNGRTGAFRSWLRAMLVNRLRAFRRSQRVRAACQSDSDIIARLADALDDPASDLSRRWDDDHDRFVARRLLDRVESEFQPTTWRAFCRVAMGGADPDQVATELGISVASVYAAKSRVLRRLREEADGLLG